MLVIFVHGWSVTDTGTYGELPEALAYRAGEVGLDIEIKHILLGKYISFNDTVTLTDVAQAFDAALKKEISNKNGGICEFSCITHSTGGPVVRKWVDKFYYEERKLNSIPMRHLIMLSPANHGSALAILGKKRVGRLKAWFAGVEPGEKILDWLALGSQGHIDLAKNFCRYPDSLQFYSFVITGQHIDKKMYDFINSYLVENGSDGVVRVAGANMNYKIVSLIETTKQITLSGGEDGYLLTLKEKPAAPAFEIPLGVIQNTSHSGTKFGIMGSIVSQRQYNKPQVAEILKCLNVASAAGYADRRNKLKTVTRTTQKDKHRYCMLVFIIIDDQKNPINDFDLYLLGRDYNPGNLSKKFFIDRQRNVLNPNHLVYYVDYDVITKKRLTGFRVTARPTAGFVSYHTVEFRSDLIDINTTIKPNQTLYIEIELHRCIDRNVFGFDNAADIPLEKKGRKYTRNSFEKTDPAGKCIDE